MMRIIFSQYSDFTRLLAVAMAAISLLGAAPSFADPVRSTSTCVQPGGNGSQIVPTRIFKPISTDGYMRTLVNPLNPTAASALTILSLGDSAMWGNGLIDDQKYSRMVAQHVADATGRTVNLISYAHSGANLSTEADQLYEPLIASDGGRPPGDLNAGLPTTLQQEGCAALKYRADAEIILLDGCINDVSAYKIALPFPFNGAKADEIRRRTHVQCSDKMLSLLNNAKTDFPKATIILSNYWRIISKKSSPFGVAMAKSLAESSPADLAMREEFQSLIDAQRRAEHETGENFIGTDSLSDPAAVFQQWSANSDAFLTTSQHCFEWAVSIADRKPSPLKAPSDDADRCPEAPKVDPQLVTTDVRVFLAVVPDDDDFAYGAGPRKHLWSVPIVRKRRDNMYRERLVLCNSHYKGIKNTGVHFICKVNATAHANVRGAEAFSDSIKHILDVAWKKT